MFYLVCIVRVRYRVGYRGGSSDCLLVERMIEIKICVLFVFGYSYIFDFLSIWYRSICRYLAGNGWVRCLWFVVL